MNKVNRKLIKSKLLIIIPFVGIFFVFLGTDLIFRDKIAFKYNSSLVASMNKTEIPNSKIEEKIIHLKTPEPLRGIYMTSWVAATRDWRKNLVDLIDKTELNAVVIDIKDYTGRIAFEVSDPDLKKIGSEEKRIDDVRDFISTLHKKNIYAIARIAVFQDPYFVKQRPDLAVKTKSGAIWKDKKGLTWIDPCAREFWDYTIKIAKEAERVGFDELNFDYIRFASDGDMNNIKYSHCQPGVSKADSLESFFKYLSENLKDIGLPISADLFGMVTTNTDDLNIGQVLEKTIPYFDYICPMVYPSHYPPTYDGYKNPALHPYEIISHALASSSQRLIIASSTPSKLRPWLQDFDLGADYTAETVRKEKQAVYDAGLTSWLMWDPANEYTRGALGEK
ncbi:MAG: putative glycoside hydrolase [Patescibacteria group bacterium]